MANPVGRPTKYNSELQAQATAYLTEWVAYDVIPSRVGLCCYIGIPKSISYAWEDKYPEFSDTCKAVEALQEREALNKGISGVFNSQITKLVLANHGYSDRQAVDHTTNGESMQPTQIILTGPDDSSET